MTASIESIPVKDRLPLSRAVLGIASTMGLCVYLAFLAHLPSPVGPSGVLRLEQGGFPASGKERPRPRFVAGEVTPIDLMQVSVATVLGAGRDEPSASPYEDLVRFWHSEIDIDEVGRIVFSREVPPAIDRPAVVSKGAVPPGTMNASLPPSP